MFPFINSYSNFIISQQLEYWKKNNNPLQNKWNNYFNKYNLLQKLVWKMIVVFHFRHCHDSKFLLQWFVRTRLNTITVPW